jgi:thiamine pyrophosphate-dependent acetolactate synthase large subunit-like protein
MVARQRIDVVRMFESVTKWNNAVYAPEVVPEVVRQAFKLAELEKPGATHIELSEDVAHQQISKDRRGDGASARPSIGIGRISCRDRRFYRTKASTHFHYLG